VLSKWTIQWGGRVFLPGEDRVSAQAGKGGCTPPEGVVFLEGDATASRHRENACSDQVANKVEFTHRAVDTLLKPIVRPVRVKIHFELADAWPRTANRKWPRRA
jgi:hypothetical protein